MKMVFLDAGTMGPVSLDPIAALGELTLYPVSTHREACERVADADVILTNKAPVDDAIMAAAPALTGVQKQFRFFAVRRSMTLR